MLLQFRFQNFRSFRDETVLDLSAADVDEMTNHIVHEAGESILPVAAVYGANASGKSNVYNAFEFMSAYVINSFGFGGEGDGADGMAAESYLWDPESRQQDTMFEVYFTIHGERDNYERIYNYGFCLNRNKVTEEWFNSKARTSRSYRRIFYRDKDGLDLSGIAGESRSNIRVALNDQTLIISLGAKLKIAKCKLVRDWFYQNEVADFGDMFTSYVLSKRLPPGFVTDSAVQRDVVQYLATFDDSIRGFEVEEMPDADDNREKTYRISTLHDVTGTNEKVKLSLGNESAGTLKMFSLYPMLKSVLSSGGILFVDELNARLHPLLVRDVVLIFLNKEQNPKHAQLIFTTHDAAQLSDHLLRRDEIWFTSKDQDGASNLYSLADFADDEEGQILNEQNYEKNYLIGKYGAIPSLRSFHMIREND